MIPFQRRPRRGDPSPGGPEAAEPGPAVRAWLESGLLDVEYWSAVRGREFADELGAARDVVRHGMPARLSPHPLVDVATLPPEVRNHWRRRHARFVVEFLLEAGHGGAHGPLAEAADRAAARRHMLETARSLAAEDPVAEAQAARVDWGRLEAGLVDRVVGRTSVVIETSADSRMTLRAVEDVRRRAAEVGDDVEVVVVDNGCEPTFALSLAAGTFDVSASTLVRLPADVGPAAGRNVGLARTTGDVVVFLASHTEVRRDWVAPLRRGLEDSSVVGVQPLLLAHDDTIESAGMICLQEGLLPSPLLAGHPKEDARGLSDEWFDTVSVAAVALRAEDVVVGEGFEAARRDVDDLHLRLRARRPGGFRVAPTAHVTHFANRLVALPRTIGLDEQRLAEHRLPTPDSDVYRRIGFELAQGGPDGMPRVTGKIDAAPGSLRWSLMLPSTAGQWGDDWGDTHFADALARGLRELGQDVVTRRRGAHDAGPTHLDDVALGIRGRYPVAPTPGKTNVLWVISHPESVNPSEFEGFDVVCAASPTWAARMAERSGRPVEVLLQATEVTAGAGEVVRRPEALFVGSRPSDRDRPMVRMALEAGIPLAVHGRGWEDLPAGVWRSTFLPPDQSPDFYRSHALVLADHWPDMAAQGFIANRVFDAVASGAMVAIDPVEGVANLFGSEVRVVHSSEELQRMLDQAVTVGPDQGAAGKVRDQHSFGVRARWLVDIVSRRLRVRGQ